MHKVENYFKYAGINFELEAEKISCEFADKFSNIVFEENPIPTEWVEAGKSSLYEIFGDLYEEENIRKAREWKREFNFKFQLFVTSYVFTKYHFNKYKCNKEIRSNDSAFDSHFWTVYYMESAVTKLIGLFDLIPHIVKEYYDMDIEENISFKKNVKNHSRDFKIKKILSYYRDIDYKKLQSLRNDMVHNWSPTNPKNNIRRTDWGIVGGSGEFVLLDEIMDDIDKGIFLLQKTNKQLKKKLHAL